MSLTLSGSGTIGGLVAGGLPDGTVLPADLSTGAPTWDSSSNLRFNSGYGSVATAYGCRAWVNFNGTGTVAIRASGNVSSITDNGTGNYTVNFTTAMPDTNYCIVASGADATSNGPYISVPNVHGDVEYAPTVSSCRIGALIPAVAWNKDQKYSYVAIFR